MEAEPKFKETEIGMIPEDWEVRTIAELGNPKEVVLTGPFGSLLHASDYAEEGVPLLLVNSIEEGKLSKKDIPKVNRRKAEELKRFWLKEGDIVEIKESSRSIPEIADSLSKSEHRGIPPWVEVDSANFKGKVINIPSRDEIQLPVQEQLIVELYSK